ncbi:MAG: SpoIIE family protein phosphatase [Defluviitaleaceae bacterium]|nr:SpoIIE family protein phosphatase [Defluviitaleaceae bacterium]
MDYKAIKSQYKSKSQLDSLAAGLSLTTKSVREKHLAEKNARDAELREARAEAAREAVMSSLVYASRIQRNLLPGTSTFQKAFSDYSILWNPRDIVSGDIYWIRNFEQGTILCVCDCTGHGTPGALLTMVVVSTFGMIVNDENYQEPATVMRLLDERLSAALYDSSSEENNDMLDIRDGCDLAILYIPKVGDVVFSSANFPIFICDGNEVTQIKGQKLFVGEGKIGSTTVKTTAIPTAPNNKYYISSDGMFDQRGGARGLPFGYSIFKKIILENHHQPQSVISDKVWQEFESYRGEHPRKDDFELISFKP